MKILVDADACPVKSQIEEIGQKYQIPIIMLIDTNHILESDYSEIITIGQGPDAVDLALINLTQKGDIIVTQDYGVATLALGQKAYAIHPSGKRYTNENIDLLLFERHISKKQRKDGKRGRHINKRTAKDNENFEVAFHNLCQMALNAL